MSERLTAEELAKWRSHADWMQEHYQTMTEVSDYTLDKFISAAEDAERLRTIEDDDNAELMESAQTIKRQSDIIEWLRAALKNLARTAGYGHSRRCPEKCFKCAAFAVAEEVLKLASD